MFFFSLFALTPLSQSVRYKAPLKFFFLLCCKERKRERRDLLDFRHFLLLYKQGTLAPHPVSLSRSLLRQILYEERKTMNRSVLITTDNAAIYDRVLLEEEESRSIAIVVPLVHILTDWRCMMRL